jgi:hypothetical protein
MIERGSYRLATDALRRLRDGHGGARRARGRLSSQRIEALARAKQVEARALDYLYGHRGTSVELLSSTERSALAQRQREQPTTTNT